MKLNTHVVLTPWLLSLSLFGLFAASGQQASGQTDQDLIEVARSVISADRKAIVVSELQLTDTESESFWPLYREYRSAMDKVNDKLTDLVRNYAKLYPEVPDNEAKQMLKTYTSIQQEHVTQRANYLKKFETVLPASKALRLAQVETRLDLVVQLNLAARIPLTPIAPAK